MHSFLIHQQPYSCKHDRLISASKIKNIFFLDDIFVNFLRICKNCRKFALAKVIDMNKIVVLAEEGEVSLIDKLYEQLGIDLRNLPIIYTGVGAINVIRALHHPPKPRDTQDCSWRRT